MLTGKINNIVTCKLGFVEAARKKQVRHLNKNQFDKFVKCVNKV